MKIKKNNNKREIKSAWNILNRENNKTLAMCVCIGL